MEFSYALTVYNKQPFLAQVIESILAEQAHTGGEFVAIDDGSTDGSREILLDYAARNPIRVILQNNRGVYAATNRLLSEVEGEWIRLTDSDDLILPGSTLALRDAIRSIPGAMAGYGRAGEYDPPLLARDLGSVAMGAAVTCLHDPRLGLIHAVELTPCQTLFHRHALGAVWPLPEDFSSCQDFSLFLRIAALGPFARLEAPVALRPRDNPHNLSSNIARTYHVSCRILLDDMARGLPTRYARHGVKRFTMRALLYFRRHAPDALGLADRLWLLALRTGHGMLGRAQCERAYRFIMALYERRL